LRSGSVHCTLTGIILPYSFSNREGHLNLAGAENRVFISAESRIAEEYKEVLVEYLEQVIKRNGKKFGIK